MKIVVSCLQKITKTIRRPLRWTPQGLRKGGLVDDLKERGLSLDTSSRTVADWPKWRALATAGVKKALLTASSAGRLEEDRGVSELWRERLWKRVRIEVKEER
ncbi:hypothetical protein PoB_002703800 [Plakobranchus ocellatus]|uniref:Uncharacterized protein n=1 Tax=Plakobranchus ocellatus TaxID=259542 RepID=A0AAV4A060_9GAST|nr:hypothetical protein PoB_002703800 [Plakobranchus ocellatus]